MSAGIISETHWYAALVCMRERQPGLRVLALLSMVCSATDSVQLV